MILRIEREWPCGYPGWFATLPVEQQARIVADRRQTRRDKRERAAQKTAAGKQSKRPRRPKRGR